MNVLLPLVASAGKNLLDLFIVMFYYGSVAISYSSEENLAITIFISYWGSYLQK